MGAITICSDLGAPKIKSTTVSTVSLFICHEVMGPDAMILILWMLSFKPTFSLPSYTFIKRLFSSSLSAIRVVSSAYLRLLIFLPTILTPAYASPSPVFLMMYSAYKLNKLNHLFTLPIGNPSRWTEVAGSPKGKLDGLNSRKRERES